MGQLATGLLSLSGWAALTLLFMLPALEAPAFLGLVLPGELALLLGGVLAHQDRVPRVSAAVVGARLTSRRAETLGVLLGPAQGRASGPATRYPAIKSPPRSLARRQPGSRRPPDRPLPAPPRHR
jgi:membrane-associated protein